LEISSGSLIQEEGDKEKGTSHGYKENGKLRVEKPRINDVPQIHRLINYFADRGEMLPRPLSELYEKIRECFVVRQNERVLACVSLHIFWSDLTEIRSLAVAEDSQEQGIGAQLVEACLQEAEQLGIVTIFCLTYRPGFFEKLNFSQLLYAI